MRALRDDDFLSSSSLSLIIVLQRILHPYSNAGIIRFNVFILLLYIALLFLALFRGLAHSFYLSVVRTLRHWTLHVCNTNCWILMGGFARFYYWVTCCHFYNLRHNITILLLIIATANALIYKWVLTYIITELSGIFYFIMSVDNLFRLLCLLNMVTHWIDELLLWLTFRWRHDPVPYIISESV